MVAMVEVNQPVLSSTFIHHQKEYKATWRNRVVAVKELVRTLRSGIALLGYPLLTPFW